MVGAGLRQRMIVVRAVSIDAFVTGGIALGLDDGAEYEEHSLEMSPGDAIVLYTDGVLEASDERRELFGEARLKATLAEAHGETSYAICARLLAAVESSCAARRPRTTPRSWRLPATAESLSLITVRRIVTGPDGAGE